MAACELNICDILPNLHVQLLVYNVLLFGAEVWEGSTLNGIKHPYKKKERQRDGLAANNACVDQHPYMKRQAGKMAEQLRSLIALAEDPGLVRKTHVELTTTCCSSSIGSNTSLGSAMSCTYILFTNLIHTHKQ